MYDSALEKLDLEDIKRQLKKNHENLKIHNITFISKDSQKKRTEEIEQTADVNRLIKNGMDLDSYYIPKVEAARQKRVLQSLCCSKLDQHMAHKCPKLDYNLLCMCWKGTLIEKL